jgi:hypothetical protein
MKGFQSQTSRFPSTYLRLEAEWPTPFVNEAEVEGVAPAWAWAPTGELGGLGSVPAPPKVCGGLVTIRLSRRAFKVNK